MAGQPAPASQPAYCSLLPSSPQIRCEAAIAGYDWFAAAAAALAAFLANQVLSLTPLTAAAAAPLFLS